jgi:hypothetical protein
MRLASAGPAAVAADLSVAGTERAARMRVPLGQAAHLLAPTVPERAVVDILHSRLADDPDWGVQVAALRDGCGRPRLVNRWPLPDLPQPALRAVLEGHQSGVVAVCPVTVGGRRAENGADAASVRAASDGQDDGRLRRIARRRLATGLAGFRAAGDFHRVPRS